MRSKLSDTVTLKQPLRVLDKSQKIELIQRSLGIRHKLKVHESMKAPDNHEEIARTLFAKWDLEDELHAIEELLADARELNVAQKKSAIEREELEWCRPRARKFHE